MAWEHVNALISRARGMRGKGVDSSSRPGTGVSEFAPGCSTAEQRASGAHCEGPADQPRLPPAQPTTAAASTTGHHVVPNAISLPTHFITTPQHQQLTQQEPRLQQPVPLGAHAPAMPDLDDNFGLADFESLENIDFSAFDAVFGDATWDNSPGIDWNWEEGVT